MFNLKSLAVRESIGSLKFRDDLINRSELAQYWTETKILHDLINTNNQAIVGRRGTGKTTLLKRVHYVLDQEMGERRVLPIYVDCNELRIANEEAFRSNLDGDASVAKYLFILIVHQIAEAIGRFHDQLEAGGFEQYVRRFLDGESRIQKVLREGIDAFDEGDLFAESEKITEKRETEQRKSSAASVDISAGPRHVAPHLRAEAKKSADSRSSTEQAVAKSRLIAPRRFQDTLVSVREIAKLAGITIILDDFTRISSFVSVQVPLLQYLRGLVVGSNGICMKLGAVRHELFPSDGHHGMSLQDDFRVIDLDERARAWRRSDPVAYAQFHQNLLFNHLLFRAPALFAEAQRIQQLALDQRPTPDTRTWATLFDQSSQCLKELVDGAMGNPRDLLLAFGYAFDSFCIRNIGGLVIGLQDVAEGLRFHYENKLQDVRKSHFAMRVAEEIARLFVLSTKVPTRVCAIKAADLARGEHDVAIRLLVANRVFHELGSVNMSPHGELLIYEIDPGTFVSCLTATRDVGLSQADVSAKLGSYLSTTARSRAELDSSILTSQIFAFPAVVAVNEKGQRHMLLCCHCNHRFSPQHPVYLSATICPQCAKNPISTN